MECAADIAAESAAFFKAFRQRAAQERIPLNGSMALTHQCNLRCRHCYARDEAGAPEEEAGTDVFLRCLDESAEAGCLSMLLTGGEPLIRPDFAEIYRYAKRKGMLVTVFTNGTRVDETIVSLFSEWPPQNVEISLYGATAETHERVTGVAGSYRGFRDGLERLLAAGVRVKLKTILMTWNQGELPEMEALAKEYGVKFRFDACIFPRLDRDASPLFSRVSAREAVEAEFADPDRARGWRELYERTVSRAAPVSDRLYTCGAGVTHFHLDARGRLRPCLMAQTLSYDFAAGHFAEGWCCLGREIENRKAQEAFACRQCDKKILCGYCPPFFALETGREDRHSSFLCDIGQQRWERITGGQRERHDDENRSRIKEEKAAL